MNKNASIHYNNIELTIHTTANTDDPKALILYLHGGGLVYGVSDDLPAVYREMLLREGYALCTLSYPLAPECPLSEILACVHEMVRAILTDPAVCGLHGPLSYILFGRSAGAYLAFMETDRLCHQSELPKPFALLGFYGYRSFNVPEFRKPSPYYAKLASVDESTVQKILRPQPVTEGPAAERFSLYVYARQKGSWPQLIGASDKQSGLFSVSDEDLKTFPPAFLTASSSDQDVPFRESKTMARLIPGSRFYPVYYLDHDFDRDTTRREGRDAYAAAIQWLRNVIA